MSNDTKNNQTPKRETDKRIRRNDLVVFDRTLAEWIGLNEAILFEYIMFNWTNRYLGKLYDGRWWLYFSATDLQGKFPFLSRSVVYHTMQTLLGQGTGQDNERQIRSRKDGEVKRQGGKVKNFKEPLFDAGNLNARKYDRTAWYTPTTVGINLYKEIIEMSQCEVGAKDFEKKYLKLKAAFYKIGVKIGSHPKTKRGRS